MSLEENKEIQRRVLVEVHSPGKLDLVDELYDENFIGLPDMTKGIENVKKFISNLLNTFPDIKFTVEDQIAEGDKVFAQWSITATHKGEFMGIAPTGKPIAVSGVTVYKILNGKVVQAWGMIDNLGILQQIGEVSLPE
jgi:steroid delta-isomerase-like uncharacterized protein